jgi:hypothetical protein
MLKRPHDDITTINAREVQDNPVVLVIEDAPRIAGIGFAALKFELPVACGAKTVDLGGLLVRPIGARRWC